ncbi:MAG: N-acetylmuramoyl-L-alanine amidase [Candidatus Tectomicrobia bacterium]|uniref:N-acetylmuramoyl-L-alanine amidase n=1 Tax=Tectimicrobiota bacterium TaxID=2528274 RepID=A0A932FYI7_UNCTE|nr:N-acetylmuramoyl-L-alanine amidase [Candidatus Tectomicrobia bacterium]
MLFLSILVVGCASGPGPVRSGGKTRQVLTRPQPGPGVPSPPAGTVLRQIRKVEHWSNPTTTRVVITTSGEVRYHGYRLKKPDRLYFDISDTRISPALKVRAIPVQDGLLKRIRLAPHPGKTVRVVLDLDTLRDYQTFVLYEPFRIVIDIQGGKENGKPLSREIRKVVLDPGHGGKDPGARGPLGLAEKEITLDIALRLKRLLQAETSWQVVLTREEDLYLPLEARTAIANREQADLFISLHVNASLRPQLKGIETYFLNPSTRVQAINLAARENQVSPERINDLQLILRDLRLSSKLDESSHLAHSIQAALIEHLNKDYPDVTDLGVRQAPFYVLMGASMPNVLVETSFLTNAQEWERLQSEDYREAIARALLQGIERYRTSPLASPQ